MPPTCSICDHPRLQEIDTALDTGASLRTIEERFGVPRSTVGRHQQHRSEAALPEEPSVSLCPAQDETEHARKRESLVHALNAAERQVTAVQEALEAHELVLARTLAVDQAGGFRPLRMDTDIDRLQPYRDWMARPQQAQAQMAALLTRWREALRGIQRATNGVTHHDQTVQEYTRQRAFLATPEGQEMETRYRDLHTAIEAATAVGNPHLLRVYEQEVEKLRYAFVQAASQTRRAAA